MVTKGVSTFPVADYNNNNGRPTLQYYCHLVSLYLQVKRLQYLYFPQYIGSLSLRIVAEQLNILPTHICVAWRL